MGIYLDRSGPGDGAIRLLPDSRRADYDLCALKGIDPEQARSPEMFPGDILAHDTMTVHSSPVLTEIKRRRTVYFEFRSARLAAGHPGFSPEWLQDRRRISELAMDVHTRIRSTADDGSVENPTVALSESELDLLERHYLRNVWMGEARYCLEL